MELRDIDRLFRDLPPARGERVPLRDVLAHQLALLADHPGAHAELVRRLGFAPTTTREELLAREHYFGDWPTALAAGDRDTDGNFEAATCAIVDGDRDLLAALLDEDPALARARSPYGHRQTLLHYCGANGIPLWRQWQTPPNIVELAELLLAAGADPNATARSYGPSDTVLGLVVTSCHPLEAGVQDSLVTLLAAHGARA